MFLREPLNTNLSDLKKQLSARSGRIDTFPVEKIKFNLSAGTPNISLNREKHPATSMAVHTFAEHLGIPPVFLNRLGERAGAGEQEHLMNTMLDHSGASSIAVRITDDGQITGVFNEGRVPMEPVKVAEVVVEVLGDTADLVRLVDSPALLSFDATIPADRDKKATKPRKVGDVTQRGLRVDLDLKRGLVPHVDPLVFRLACTNGYVTEDNNLRLDGRGKSVDEVLEDFHAMCERAFSRAEASIDHLYALQDVSVDNPERTIRSIARERRLPDRTTMALIDLASGQDLPDNPSMFDVVNLVTNYANAPSIHNDGGRRILEQAGGSVIVDDAAMRCGHCAQRVHTE